MGKPWENGKNLDFMGKTMGKAMENAGYPQPWFHLEKYVQLGSFSPNDLHGGFHSHGGYPNRWMVMEVPINIFDLGVPIFGKPPHVWWLFISMLVY